MLKQYLDETNIEVGIDEAGRGCLFGPVTVGAVIWPHEDPLYNDNPPPEIKDSKKVSVKKRYVLKDYIETNAIAWSVQFISHEEIDKTNIYAPFDGILTSNHLEIGEFVQPGTTLGVFIELNPILIIGYVSEKELKNLYLNSKALVTTSLGKKVEGLISYISPIAEKVTRTFRIEITVSNNNLEIKDGLTASIKIQGEKIDAHKISPSILSLKDNGTVGIKIVNKKNIVEFFPIEVISDTNEGMWISGIPKESNIITVGQEYAPIGEEVNFDKIN